MITRAQLLKVYAEACELERGGYICKHARRGWVVVDADGREVAL